MITNYYFGYGANTNSVNMALRCPDSKILTTAKILDYQLVFRIFADIELNSGTVVHGLLWELNEKDLIVLDKFESVPKLYIRHMMWVYPNSFENIPSNNIHNNAVKAWVYEMVNKDEYNYPSDRYWNICIDGYNNNNIGTSQLDIAYSNIKI